MPYGILPANIPNVVLLGIVEDQFDVSLIYGDWFVLHFPLISGLKMFFLWGLIVHLFPAEGAPAEKSDAMASMSWVEWKLTIIMAAVLLGWGRGLVWVWPHDGLAHDKTSGVTLAHQYRAQGLAMHPERVTFPDGSNGLEAGVMDMLQRLQSGRLRVFSGAPDWFEEYRLYHRKSGQIVSERDDLLAATRYALMGLRHARTATEPQRPNARREGGAFTPAQFDALRDLCVQINAAYDGKVTFHGHQEVANRACPVFDYRRELGLSAQGYLRAPRPSLSRSRTFGGTRVAAVGLATVSLHEAIELGEVVSPVLSVALQTVPLLAVALIAIGLGVVVWARMDDHARGIR